MRLSWTHKLGEQSDSMRLTAEGFNIANHTNFASVNNEVSPLFGFLRMSVEGVTPHSMCTAFVRARFSRMEA